MSGPEYQNGLKEEGPKAMHKPVRAAPKVGVRKETQRKRGTDRGKHVQRKRILTKEAREEA